ncbi:hypothetical protein OROHE_023768 [Orobanche hederae]
MATMTELKLENPKSSSGLNEKPPVDDDALLKQTPASSGGGLYESKDESAAAARTSDAHDSGAVTDIQKKMKRAERFGMPMKMTEEEKRNSRAERVKALSHFKRISERMTSSRKLTCILFSAGAIVVGYISQFHTGSAANGSDTCKALEVLKKKSRAERFGIVQSDTSDEEAKKKARLARFGCVSKTDTVEEDKKKARALRFSQPDSGSKTNGKGNIVMKDTASKAGLGT